MSSGKMDGTVSAKPSGFGKYNHHWQQSNLIICYRKEKGFYYTFVAEQVVN